MKKFRKGLCLFLASAMLLSFLPAFSIGAFAADAGTTPDFAASGSGTEASPYIISTADQLAAFSEWVNAGENTEYVYVKLSNDIVLEHDEYEVREPIGTKENAFFGCFNGDGHVVSNIRMYNDYGMAGLFGKIKDSTVKNVGIKDSDIGWCVGEYNDVIDSECEAAAIAVYVYNSRIENCYSEAAVEGKYAAGIATWVYSSVIVDCYNNGSVEADKSFGGIACYASGSQIINCHNRHNLWGGIASCGGIVEEAGVNTQIINCSNTGEVYGTFSAFCGGIVAEIYSDGVLIEGCSNSGDIDSIVYAGGILGYTNGNPIITNCSNSGETYCCSGYLEKPDWYEMEYIPDLVMMAYCTYDKELGRYVGMGAGAIIGRSDGQGLIKECYNTSKKPFVGYDNGNVTIEGVACHYYTYVKNENRLEYKCVNCGDDFPKITNVTATYNKIQKVVEVTWDSLGDGWTYYVRALNKDLYKLSQKTTKETSISLTGVKPGETYGFLVYAYKNSAEYYAAEVADIVLITIIKNFNCKNHKLETEIIPSVCGEVKGTKKTYCVNEECTYVVTEYLPYESLHDYYYEPATYVQQGNYLIRTCSACGKAYPYGVEGVKAECENGRITVSWNKTTFYKSDYKYYVAILDEDLNVIKIRNTYETSLTMTGFEDGKTYAFMVYTNERLNANIVLVAYEKGSSEIVIPPQTTNTKVSNVVASVDEERLNVSWNAFKDASGYYVYVYENGKQITCKNAGTKTSVSFIDGLKPEVDYTVKVIAKVGSKYQSKDVADEVAGRIKEKPLAQTYVKNVTASTNETRLNVYWDAVDGAETYYVYVYENGTQVTCKNAGTNTSISIIDGLVEETNYTVKVIAKVNGKYMSKDDATVVSGRICAKSPDKVYVTENNPGTVKIAWKAVNGANEYYVRVTDEYGYKKVTRTSNTNLTLGGLDAGGKYNVEVAVQIKRTATNGSNTYTTLNYGAINEITVAEPVSISVNAEADGNGVKVSWSAPEKATTYYVYEKVGDTWKVLITLNNPEKAEINIKNATSGEHTYSVIARLNYNGANIYTERFISNTITL